MGKVVYRICCAGILVVSFATSSSLGQTIRKGAGITAVSGESWLQHLHRSFDETSMGKTERLGPPELVPTTAGSSIVRNNSGAVLLSGADLYRLNCRGCHGETGAGAPPEINSLINPVRATSVAAVMERMKNAGAEISRAEAAKLAAQSRTMLLQRLHNGGQDMPPFAQLSDTDVQVLIGYLKELAEVPGRRENATVRVSTLRVGELIVKSTCHTCHSADGENPTAQQLSAGAIPPLSVLTTRVDRAGFIRKVTQGAPVKMGQPEQLCRGRMPVFYYLSEEEATDVYEYLLRYPPEEADSPDETVALSHSPAATRGDPPAPAISAKETLTPSKNGVEDRHALFIIGALTLVLLMGGAALSVREMRKLGAVPPYAAQIRGGATGTSFCSTERDLVA